MGRIKDFFEFIKLLEKEEGVDSTKPVEKGFYFRTMGLSIIIMAILLVVIIIYAFPKGF